MEGHLPPQFAVRLGRRSDGPVPENRKRSIESRKAKVETWRESIDHRRNVSIKTCKVRVSTTGTPLFVFAFDPSHRRHDDRLNFDGTEDPSEFRKVIPEFERPERRSIDEIFRRRHAGSKELGKLGSSRR